MLWRILYKKSDSKVLMIKSWEKSSMHNPATDEKLEKDARIDPVSLNQGRARTYFITFLRVGD
jgi:hypothetical protein